MGERHFSLVLVNFFLSFCSLVFFIIFLLPLILSIFCVSYVWRICLIGYVRLSNKYLRIMNGQNPVVAIDDLQNPLSTLVGMGAFDGQLDFFKASTYVSAVVNAKDATGRRLNPELRQYYEEWLGFLWWKEETKFELEEHVKLWNSGNEIYTEEDVIRIIGILEKLQFAKNKSPWEVVVVRNVQLRGVEKEEEPKTLIIFRFHHGLADGIAVMQLFMKFVFDDAFEKVASRKFIDRSLWRDTLRNFLAGIQLPYEFFKQSFVSYDVNDWHVRESELKREVTKAWTKRIPIECIKRAKVNHKVGFTAVLISVIASCLRQAMIADKIKIPKKIHAILPLPWPGHPSRLCNHWSYGFIPLPVGTENLAERLRKCEKYVTALKRSITPAVNFNILKFFNLLPTWLIRNLTLTNYFPTVILSNFPGPPPGTQGIGGFPLVDTCFTGGPLRGSIPISITILSYDGYLRIVLGIDKAIFPKEEMTRALVDTIEHEFEKLI